MIKQVRPSGATGYLHLRLSKPTRRRANTDIHFTLFAGLPPSDIASQSPSEPRYRASPDHLQQYSTHPSFSPQTPSEQIVPQSSPSRHRTNPDPSPIQNLFPRPQK